MSVRGWLVVACLSLGLAAPVVAAGIDVHVSDQHGHPTSDAVITLTLDGSSATPAPVEPSKTYYIDQKNETFIPYVQIFRPGDKVIFRNSDTTRHQVYSFSAIANFEYVLRPGQSAMPMTLDKTGIAAVGCNIHDDMITYMFVSSAPYVAMSSATGDASLDHLAPGHYTVRLWHPQLHPGQALPVQQVTLSAESDHQHLDFALSLIPDPRQLMRHRQPEY